jgi:S-phase kinase-associated protein 1
MTLANLINERSPELIRSYFNIVKDFAPEEEDELRRQNLWYQEF